MFYFLFEFFSDDPGILRIFSYVTFRALMAGLTSMFFSFYFGNMIIERLYRFKFKENVRSDGPKSHESKAGTPTMGGLMIIFALLLSIAFWGNLTNSNLLLLCGVSFSFSLLGFRDDYEKAILKIKGGMNARTKFVISILLAFAFSVTYFYMTSISPGKENRGIHYAMTDLFIPFIKGPVLDLGIWMVPFSILIIISSTHAVNLTDGLDGLAAGTMAIATTTLGIIAYVSGTPVAANYLNIPYLPGAHEYSVFLSALSGALIGFLWFNSHPAQVFMGDTGSLFLGATLGTIAIMLKKELYLPILGGLFVIEALSVILQVGSFRLRQKRIFRMAPIHHHFELLGLKETKIVTRFYIIAIILALITLSTLKIQ
ncbi:MAG: phospho-N-acetylmuramoyl-pentapeptide-transferase [Leptospiraceae bacterium]|nr:phospho-N-acetylmuramoyl-pentapeptide-transferase [Leptospiraceae bacterium]MCP5511194.1 phospho-N-acetylmuramoyl-pentapeptide-transferase [Leptospiraceae bacterium]